ncbi:hypothetical protein ACWDSJ_06145 [Nocardia sp. NPDC003482]
MTAGPAEFIATLKRFGTLEWYRFGGGITESGIYDPPLIVWRYAEPRPSWVAEKIQQLVGAEDLLIDWAFDTSRRNWVLVPARVLEEQERQSLPTDASAVALLMRNDQDFCRQAVLDFELIVQNMARMSDDS